MNSSSTNIKPLKIESCYGANYFVVRDTASQLSLTSFLVNQKRCIYSMVPKEFPG